MRNLWLARKIHDYIKVTELYTIFKSFYPNTFSFEGEMHDFWEFSYVIKGGMIVSAGDKVYSLSEGDIILYKPMQLHKFNVDSRDGVTVLVFSFSATGKGMDYFCDKVFKADTQQIELINRLIDFIYSDADDIQRLNAENFPSHKTSNIDLQRMAIFITELLLSLSEKNQVTNVFDTPDSLLFSEAVRYMTENLSEKLSITQIAKECCVSTTKLKSVFAKFSGFGVHKYLLSLKINRASKLLTEGKSVTEISEELSFSSQGYFSAAFKRETGLSPSEYKKAQT